MKKQAAPDSYFWVCTPMNLYVGGHYLGLVQWGYLGRYLRLNKIESHELECDHFIRLKGYKGKFKILWSRDSWSGIYHICLMEEKPPPDYGKRIPVLTRFDIENHHDIVFETLIAPKLEDLKCNPQK